MLLVDGAISSKRCLVMVMFIRRLRFKFDCWQVLERLVSTFLSQQRRKLNWIGMAVTVSAGVEFLGLATPPHHHHQQEGLVSAVSSPAAGSGAEPWPLNDYSVF